MHNTWSLSNKQLMWKRHREKGPGKDHCKFLYGFLDIAQKNDIIEWTKETSNRIIQNIVIKSLPLLKKKNWCSACNSKKIPFFKVGKKIHPHAQKWFHIMNKQNRHRCGWRLNHNEMKQGQTKQTVSSRSCLTFKERPDHLCRCFLQIKGDTLRLR